ncbi:collagenase [Aliikangiella coralliicola]|uniref:microbial collagenase n=1 Tax=Aliikangiella coralliicola TaxID=2592383 RepID=A0A545UE56_9GAMM|nr:collagenase [Aliikangiella coralliicola]TQV87749.1 PKD domain-containing protein [Aliikangiella coralliicola]
MKHKNKNSLCLIKMCLASLLVMSSSSQASSLESPKVKGVSTLTSLADKRVEHSHDKHVHSPNVAVPLDHSENSDISITKKDALKNKKTSSNVSAAIACNDDAFSTSGSALLNEIKTQGIDCVERFFNDASDSAKLGTFTQANIITVANEAKSKSQSYNGTDPGEYLSSLYYWIRAFYYYGNRQLLTPENQDATAAAAAALFANSHFYDKTEVNAAVVEHAAVDLNNALIGERFVTTTKNLLDQYDASFEGVGRWGNALAELTWTTLNSCANKPECRAAEHNSSLISVLGNFIHDNLSWVDKPSADYHLHNVAYQLANIYRGRNDSHFASIKSDLEFQLNKIFNNFGYDKGDTGRRAYLLALSGLNYNDSCDVYNLCSKKEEIITNVLNDRITCPSGTLFMWAQDMNQAQLEWACNSLGAHETYFHSSMKTNNTPVVPDDNDKLRMVVFNNSREWGMYGGVLFGASTDNGGLYLEGDPSKPGDQATFFAYEDVPERPIFDIWNLRHEYIHYLDGRFNTQGDFGDINGAGRTVWYGEGIAEFISRKNCNDEAAAQAAAGTYDISTIFQNEYGVGQTRIYPWGYLAVRYMFEKHNSVFFDMLEKFRKGKYQEYRDTMVDQWVNNKTYDASFAAWLPTVTSTGCVIDNTRPPSPVEPINVDDVQGNDQVGINACAAGQPSDETRIEAGVAMCLKDVSNGGWLQLATSVPVGLVDVTMQITLRHGSGNADILHKHDSRPTDSDFDYKSDGPTTEETVLVDPVKPGWNYIHIRANQNFSGVTLLTRYIQNGVNVAPSAEANGPYTEVVNSAVSFSSSGSSDSDGTIASYHWDFGDNNSSSDANPSHSYSAAGTYTATLTVTDNDGATATDTATVTITDVSSGDELQNGVPKTGLAATQNNDIRYYIDVPAGATNFVVEISGGTGDADLYTRFSAEPTDSEYKCRPWKNGNAETCTEANPSAGRWHVRVKAYNTFSGVTLKASYTAGGGNQSPIANANGPYTGNVGTAIVFDSSGSSDPDGSISSYSWNFGDGSSGTGANPSHSYNTAGSYNVTLTVTDNQGATSTASALVTVTEVDPNALQNGVPKTGLAASQNDDLRFYIDVPAGATNLVVKINGGSGDADLYTRFNAEPTDSDYNCRPWVNGNTETCTEPSPGAGRWHVRVKGYNTFSGLTLTASFD